MASREHSSRFTFIAGLRTGAVALVLALFAICAQAAVIDADPSNYLGLVSSLSAGDTLQLASGTYTQGLILVGKAGTGSQPIIVVGPEDQSAVFTARDCCNTVQLDGVSYVQIVNLTVNGAGRSGSAGVSSRGNSHHVVLENLKIVGYGAGQDTVGISTRGPAWGWIVRHNTIIGAGTGLSLGVAEGTQPFVAGLIEYNRVLDSDGRNIEIADQLARPEGVGLPTSDSRTIIRHNVFSTRGAMAASDGVQPNLRLGRFPMSGPGANDFYEIYDNLFYRKPTDVVLSAEGKLVVHDNLFVTAAGDVVSADLQSELASKSVRAAAVGAAITPTLALSASPGNVSAGGTSLLSWTSTDAAGCSASGGWSGTKAPSGSETVGPIQSTTSFQLTCLGTGGNANAIVQVTVGGGAAPPGSPPPSTTPPPPTPPSMDSGEVKSGGGGSFDAMAIVFLTLIAWLRARRAFWATHRRA